MKAVKSKKFSEPIIFYVKQKNSTILIADKTTAVRFLDQQNLETLGGFKANINHKWYKNQVISFSNSGDYFAVVSEDVRSSKLYDASTKKVKQKINRHHGEVSCVAVDPRGNYFFSAGEDGRCFVVDTKSARLVFTLPHHADTINDIKFFNNSYLVATASYDKKIHIFNYGTITPIATLKAHTAAVMKVEFLTQNILCSVDKNSSVIIWDINAQKVIKRLDGIHDEIVEITSNEHFLFLGTQLGFVIVYDLSSYEQVSRKFIKVDSRITCLEYDAEQGLLIVADDLGELLYYDVYTGLDKLQKHIMLAEYDKAYKLIKKNPLLEYTDSYKKIEELWNKIYDKALKFLQGSKKEKALNLFGSFTEIPSKNSKIKKLFNEFDEFDKFLALVKSGKISLAYSLVNQHPLYKESDIYKALELKWQKLFLHAQKMALESKPKEQIRELLSEFRGVSEKTAHIQEMLIKSDIYTRFKNSIIKKDFKMVFELVRVNPFLKEFLEYSKVITFGDTLYINLHKYIEDNEIHKAVKLLDILVDFPDFKDEVKSIKLDIESRDKLYQAIEKSNFDDIYNIIDNSETLINTPEGRKYNKLWSDDFEVAKEYALNGDPIGIYGILEKYKSISSKYVSIANIYALAYVTQIEKAIKTNKDKTVLEKAFKTYILHFGTDDYILSTYELFCKKYDSKLMDMDSLRKGSKKQWRSSMRVENILE
ncbi:hypothetical protein [Sulfurimonas sp.]|uniref:hypothetical protein n=1 Tax=Sulfurimonas sp. TaxID=2022749 RepID=UPI00356616CD